MNKQKLNKKLAEWAFPSALECDVIIDGIWIITDEGEQKIRLLTESLDACFKWLVPKLPINAHISVSKDIDRPTYYARILGHYFDSPQYVGIDDGSPALALCLAIEKLIGKEKE